MTAPAAAAFYAIYALSEQAADATEVLGNAAEQATRAESADAERLRAAAGDVATARRLLSAALAKVPPVKRQAGHLRAV